jgi:hypothetical protein
VQIAAALLVSGRLLHDDARGRKLGFRLFLLQFEVGVVEPRQRLAGLHDPARLDQDGFPDVVLWDRSSPRVRFLLGGGDGSLRAQDFELVLPQNPSSLRPSDLNGDNHGDVVVAFGSSRPIQAFLGQ